MTFENEAILIEAEVGGDQFEIVYPSLSIAAAPPVAVVDAVVDRRGTRKIAEAYLHFLYAPSGQEIIARHHLRPRDPAVMARAAHRSARCDLHRRGGARRLGKSTEGAFRRRRRLRSDLCRTMTRSTASRRVLPGFGLSLGFTLTYLSLIVLVPLSAVFVKTASLSLEQFWSTVTAPRVLASYRLSFGASLLAAAINAVFGLMLAWALVRYTFPGKRLIDALVDLPFALPTAVAGISTALYARNGWLGQYLEPLGIKVAFTPLGVLVALIFIGLPFVVRTVQPVLEDMDADFEEAAATLGASRWQAFTRVVLPTLTPALLTGFALAFARAVGEYGSVIFIAGNIPMVSRSRRSSSSPSSSSTTTGEQRDRRRHAPGLLRPAAAHQRLQAWTSRAGRTI